MKINLNDNANSRLASEPARTIDKQIIVALDMPTAIAALELCDRLPDVTFWKVGLELFIADGAAVLRELKARQKKIFLDLKLHDIPNTVGSACRVATKYGADFLTIHAAGGRAMMQAAQTEIAGSATQLLAISLLTSISASELNNDLQVALDVPEYVWQMISMAQASGLTGAVCSPHEVKDLRSRLRLEFGEEIGNNFCFVTPGVRPTGSDVGDQRRVMTPQAAIAAGANYLVIGRPITAAADPVAAWQAIINPV
ncbi:orotidine-5'-phosphate decarboxylase [Pseudanabaena sp. FACHB-1277]|jgi:orotidine-5'-phosphate decarboxylase|uniref:Orotidine 5'-phosphate decarboxylase n=1 Tax=Pseudanabaena cinerea FACHB-1277 TaxID=2949581 RepID=A0A926UPQ9_9CYAN|nr:orotidine-5'-phosphate decarboxylase [Pseudanabaena cinerea]MBD2148799.1 orotidine-5'-phosphate decarboxylase [Pseudanabaena cinerea FACHB-1277]